MNPPLSALLQSLKTTVRIARQSRLSAIPRKEVPAGTELIILGNGPSLKADIGNYTSFFKSKPSLCVNDFPRTELFGFLKPRYYVMLDPAYWLKESSPELLRLREEIFRSIREGCDWPFTVMAPIEARPDLPECPFPGMSNVRLEYFNNTPLWGLHSLKRYFMRKGLGMIPTLNVLAAALQIGILLGYRKLYLFGGDHSWHRDLCLNEASVLCIQESHFYAEEARLTPFYKDAAQTETWTMQEIFQRYADIFGNYAEIGHLAEAMGVEILNGASTTFIDAFPRFKPEKAAA